MEIKEKERIFKALGDENRLRIMHMLIEKERCACEILEDMHIGQSTLSHHMKILCDSGIVNSRKDSRWVYYSINTQVLGLLMQDITSVIQQVHMFHACNC